MTWRVRHPGALLAAALVAWLLPTMTALTQEGTSVAPVLLAWGFGAAATRATITDLVRGALPGLQREGK